MTDSLSTITVMARANGLPNSHGSKDRLRQDMPTASKTSSTARSRVREEIQAAILSGDYPPGSQLRQLELSKRFDAAQSVVREALLELQTCGLVRSVDNLGVFVEDLGPDQIVQAYQIREVFEGMAARLCCDRISPAELRRLEQMIEEIYSLGRKGKHEQRGIMDREFHQTLIHISQNKVLERLTQGYRILGMAIQAGRDHDTIRKEHLAIVRAIAQHKPDEAEERAREHVRGSQEAIEKQIAAGRFKPRWVAGSE